MAVKHAVLGLLVERRAYGHELVARLDERLGPGFAVPSGTVYTALSTLEQEGDIRVLRRVPKGKMTRVYYEPTPDGIRHFEEWMDEPTAREATRGELYLKFALITMSRVPTLREEFQRLELECLADISRHTLSPDLAALPDPVPPALVARLLLDSGDLDRLNAELAFIRRTLSVLRWAEDQGMVSLSMMLEAVPASG